MSDGFSPLQFELQEEQQMIDNSKDFLRMMQSRRSVRDFSDRPVPEEIVVNAIKTAATAPSGANKQPWHFALIKDAAIKKQIRIEAEAEERAFYEERATDEWLKDLEPLGTDAQKPFLETAPYLIPVFLQKFTIGNDGERHKHYYTAESVGIACGFLLAALHQAGLATLTHTPSPMKFLNKICSRPDYERPFMLIVTGYPAENALVPDIDKHPLDAILSRF
jgi:nitroreductase